MNIHHEIVSQDDPIEDDETLTAIAMCYLLARQRIRQLATDHCELEKAIFTEKSNYQASNEEAEVSLIYSGIVV